VIQRAYDAGVTATSTQTTVLATNNNSLTTNTVGNGTQYTSTALIIQANTPTQTSGTQSVDPRQIDQGVGKVFNALGYGNGTAAVELAKQLRNQTPEYQAAFMKELSSKLGPGLVEGILADAGGRLPSFVSDARPSSDDTQVIANALGNAYDSGAIGPDFVQKMLNFEQQRLPGENQFLGDLIGQSNSRGLKETFFDQSMNMYSHSPSPAGYYKSTANFISGAAAALAGDPALLQQKLASMERAGTLDDFLKNLDPRKFNPAIIPEYDNSYAKIVTAAGQIQPPTPEVTELFRYTANNYMGGSYNDTYQMAEAMTQLYTSGYTTYARFPNGKIADSTFHSNAQYFLMQLSRYGTQTDGTPVVAGSADALRNFFANTAFNDNFPDSQLVMDTTSTEIANLEDAIQSYPNIDPQTKALIDGSTYVNPNNNQGSTYQVQQEMAYRLGQIDGDIFNGYEEAVQNRNADNAARDNLVNFVFQIIPLDKATAAASEIPGVGSVAGMAADEAVSFGEDKLKEWLHDTDLNQNRTEVFNTLETMVANSLTPDLSSQFTTGFNNATGLQNDQTNDSSTG